MSISKISSAQIKEGHPVYILGIRKKMRGIKVFNFWIIITILL